MRYSSHLYFRTDGTLGRYPIIEVDPGGRIVGLRECTDTLTEMGSQRFYSGVIVPCFVDADAADIMSDEAMRRAFAQITFYSREAFCRSVGQLTIGAARRCGRLPLIGAIEVGSAPGLLLIDGFDLNSFSPAGARMRRIL